MTVLKKLSATYKLHKTAHLSERCMGSIWEIRAHRKAPKVD